LEDGRKTREEGGSKAGICNIYQGGSLHSEEFENAPGREGNLFVELGMKKKTTGLIKSRLKGKILKKGEFGHQGV